MASVLGNTIAAAEPLQMVDRMSAKGGVTTLPMGVKLGLLASWQLDHIRQRAIRTSTTKSLVIQQRHKIES